MVMRGIMILHLTTISTLFIRKSADVVANADTHTDHPMSIIYHDSRPTECKLAAPRPRRKLRLATPARAGVIQSRLDWRGDRDAAGKGRMAQEYVPGSKGRAGLRLGNSHPQPHPERGVWRAANNLPVTQGVGVGGVE
jgi:hypothetical protein